MEGLGRTGFFSAQGNFLDKRWSKRYFRGIERCLLGLHSVLFYGVLFDDSSRFTKMSFILKVRVKISYIA